MEGSSHALCPGHPWPALAPMWAAFYSAWLGDWKQTWAGDLPALTLKWMRVLSVFGADRGGLVPGLQLRGESHHPGSSGHRTLRALFDEHLWANVQVAASESLSSCLLTLGNSSCISRWIEAGLFQGLRGRNWKGLQKSGFSSVGFAAALMSSGWEYALLWAAQMLPQSSPALQQASPCVSTPTAAQGRVKHSHRADAWAASPGLVKGGGPGGQRQAGVVPTSAELVHYKVLARNNFLMGSPLGLFETRLQKKTTDYAFLNRRI